MFLQDRKHFRFRFHFSRVLLLAFLLVSPTQGGKGPSSDCCLSCVEVEVTLVKSLHKGELGRILLLQDTKFTMKLVDCFQVMEKQIQQNSEFKIPKQLQDLIKNLPDLMKKVKDFAPREGLVLLSVYLLYKSTELYVKALEVEKGYKIQRGEFVVLQEELIPIKGLIAEEIVPQWKKGNTANMVKGIEKLIESLTRYSNVLKELVYRIHENIKQGSSDRIWSITYSIFAVGVCVGSIGFSGYPVAIILTCGIGVGTCATCYETYNSLGETLKKSDVLWKETAELRTEVAKYRGFLEAVKMKDSSKYLILMPLIHIIVTVVVCLVSFVKMITL